MSTTSVFLFAETWRTQKRSDSCYVILGVIGSAGNILGLLDLSIVGPRIVCRWVILEIKRNFQWGVVW